MPKQATYRDRVKRRPFCSEPSCRWHDYPVFGEHAQLWDASHWPKLQRFWLNDRWLCYECSGGKGESKAPRDDRGTLPAMAAREVRQHEHASNRASYGEHVPGTRASRTAEVDEVFSEDEDDPAF